MSLGEAIFVTVLLWLATYRATRLITVDAFPLSVKLREGVARRFGADGWQSYLVECPGCVSVYFGALFTFLAWLFLDLPFALLVWPACSAATIYLTNYDDRRP